MLHVKLNGIKCVKGFWVWMVDLMLHILKDASSGWVLFCDICVFQNHLSMTMIVSVSTMCLVVLKVQQWNLISLCLSE